MIANSALDLALNFIRAGSHRIVICEDKPTTYSEAVGEWMIGYKAFGVGLCFQGGLVPGEPDGRQLISTPVTDGVIVRTGNAAFWAAVGISSTLYAAGPLPSIVHIELTDLLWTCPAFRIRIPSG